MQKSSTFVVKQENFEGPLELLLSLIEKRKLNVSDVSLSQVTREYVEEIQQHEERYIAHMAEFLVVASTLLLIKSRSLLPTLDLSQEENSAIEELEARLELYRILRRLSRELGKRIPLQSFVVPMERARKQTIVWPDPANLTIQAIIQSTQKLTKEIPEKKAHPEVRVEIRKSLEEVINDLEDRIKKQVSILFSGKGSTEPQEKHNHIVTFLALLELVKQNSIDLLQTEPFGTIELENRNPATPSYT